MSIDIGIIGLAQSGKTTVFNALTGGKAATGSYTERQAAHVGVAKVPESRIDTLADMLQPRRVVPAEVRYIDIGASVRSLAKDKGIGGELLNQLSNADALINVVRAFTEASLPHPEGSLDVARDIVTMDLELVFSDLAIIERRLERIETSLKSAKPAERQAFVHEQETLHRFQAELEKDTPIREMELDPAEVKMIANYQFLTAKPLLIVVNIGEAQLADASAMETELNARYGREECRVITLCGKLETELAQLEDGEAEEFRADFGLKESGLSRVIQQSYQLLGLISFFTTASNEVRAWSIPSGTAAPRAAGKIHTDMERGFIRAEVTGYDDLVKCGGPAQARRQGLVRLEGKDYIVRDGDVITFLFNV
jgi:GTP-binding protein YchF